MDYKVFILVLLGLAVFIRLEGSYFDAFNFHHKCVVDRFSSSSPKVSLVISDLVLAASKWLIGVVVILNYLYIKWDSRVESYKAFKLPAAVIWYISSYGLLHVAKIMLDDSNCARGKPNSVSGHFSFHIFYFLTLLYTTVDLKRSFNDLRAYGSPRLATRFFTFRLSAQAFISILSIALFAATSGFTLYRTYFYGFHSFAQIVAGIIHALIVHYTLILAFEHTLDSAKQWTALAFVLFAVMQSVGFVGVYILTEDFPFDVATLVVNGLCWAYIGFLVFRPVKVDHKRD